MNGLSKIFIAVLLAAALLLPACGDDDGLTVAQFAGTWNAVNFVTTCGDDQIDLIADGCTYAFTAAASGTYSDSTVCQGSTQAGTGELSIVNGQLVMAENGGETETFTPTLNGNNLNLYSTGLCDCNHNGTADQICTANVDLTRQ